MSAAAAADSMADAPPVAAASVTTSADPATPVSSFVISDEDQRELDRQARLARKRDHDRLYRQKKNEEKAKAAARKPAAGGGAAAKPKHAAHAAAPHTAAAASVDKPLVPESSSPKRVKRAHPAAADDDDEGGAGVAGSSHPSPSVWSILADLVFLPRFLSLVHAQLATTRTANINFHMLASAFRQKLVEGGWQRDQHYTLHGPTEALMSEAKEDSSSSSAAAAGSSAPPAGVYLLKSKRAVSDFTPSVCQRLWSLVAYQRDSSPQAAVEMLHAGTRHRRLEERCRELRVPIMTGGKLSAPPQGATLKIERMFGLPKGADIGIKGAAAASAAASAAAASAAAAAAPGSTAAPAASVPPPAAADNDDSDVEDTFEFWPGVYGDSLHGPQFRLEGATVQRWARGHHVHVPPIAQDPTAQCHTHGLPLVSPAAAVGITDPAQVALINQLSSRASLVSQVNQLRGTFRTDVARGPIHLDWSTGDCNAEILTTRELFHRGVSTMVPTSILAKAETAVSQWRSPSDDRTLLDGVCDWLQRQPLPTRESLSNLPEGVELLSALMPRSPSAWAEIRHAISATMFPVEFLRRRFWLLCGETSRFQQEQHAAAAEAQASGNPMPAVRNPAFAALAQQVINISNLQADRMKPFMAEQPHNSDSNSAQAANGQEKQTANETAQPDAATAAPATDALTPAVESTSAPPAAAPATDAPQAMELDGQSAMPALS